MSNTLVLGAALAVLAAILYAYVAVRVGRRRVSEDARLASKLFALWWNALAGITALGALSTILGLAGVRSLPVYVAISNVALLCLVLGLWALLYYLVFLYTGSRRALVPLSVCYALLYAATVGVQVWRHPLSVTEGTWSTTIAYERPLPRAGTIVFTVLILVPQLLAALAYLSLYFRLEDRTKKYRVLLVSGSILFVFAAPLVGPALAGEGWPLVSRIIGLAAATATLAAFVPPTWIRARWGVRSIDDEQATPA